MKLERFLTSWWAQTAGKWFPDVCPVTHGVRKLRPSRPRSHSLQYLFIYFAIYVCYHHAERDASSHNQSCFLMVEAAVREGHLLGSAFPTVTFHCWVWLVGLWLVEVRLVGVWFGFCSLVRQSGCKWRWPRGCWAPYRWAVFGEVPLRCSGCVVASLLPPAALIHSKDVFQGTLHKLKRHGVICNTFPLCARLKKTSGYELYWHFAL